MMPAPYGADLRWRVIWFVHILQNSEAGASFFLGICERTVNTIKIISKFLVSGGVKPEPVGRTTVVNLWFDDGNVNDNATNQLFHWLNEEK